MTGHPAPTSPNEPAVSDGVPRLTFWSLDVLRGLAAIWVVMNHAALGPIAQNFPELRSRPLYSTAIFGMLGVQLFFVISGFCIASAATNGTRRGVGAAAFVRARLRRIYPPYLCALLAAAAMSLAAMLLVHAGILRSSRMAESGLASRSIVWYVSQLTLTQVPLGQDPLLIVFWTLCYEVAFYGLVAIVLTLALRQGGSIGTLLGGLHLLTVISLCVLAVRPSAAFFPFDLWPQFGFGVLVYDAIANGRATRRVRLATAAAAVALTAYVTRFDLGGDEWHLGSRVTFCVAAGFAVGLLLLHPFDKAISGFVPLRVLAWVGTFSYSLYLIHLLPMGIALQLGRPLMTADRFFSLFVAQVSLALAAAYVFFRLCERPFLSRKAADRARAEAVTARDSRSGLISAKADAIVATPD